jgi:hypothetical protein
LAFEVGWTTSIGATHLVLKDFAMDYFWFTLDTVLAL